MRKIKLKEVLWMLILFAIMTLIVFYGEMPVQ